MPGPALPMYSLAMLLSAAGAVLAADPSTQPSPTTRPTTVPTTGPTTQSVEWLGKPTRLSLSLKNASPHDAFKALETASGVTIPLPAKELFERQTDRRVTLEATDITWLEAAVEIADQSNVRLAYYGARWNVSFGGAVRITPRRYFVGPLLATCNRVMVDNEVRYGTPQTTQQTITLSGSLLAEPRVQSLQLQPIADFVEGTDDRGRPLVAVPPAGDRPIIPASSFGMGERRDFSINMLAPDLETKSIARVKAMLRVGVLARTETLSIPDVLNSEGLTTRLGEMSFTVERIEQSGQSFIVQLRIEPATAMPGLATSLRSNQPPFQPKIVSGDAGNQAVTTDARVTNTVQRGNTLNVTLTIFVVPRRNNADLVVPEGAEAGSRPPVTINWMFPLEYQQVDVPIEFENVPLPK